MTKTNYSRLLFAVLLGALFFCFCAKLGESTNLGSGVINGADPYKTNIDRYFHGLLLDSTSLLERFSVPSTGDPGFGIHSGGSLFLGNANKEHSVGYIELIVVRDSLAATRFFVGGDTLRSLKIVFTRDSVFPVIARQFDLYRVYNKDNVFDTTPGGKLGTVDFSETGTASKIDTVTIFDPSDTNSFGHLFSDTIFAACTTSTVDTAQRRDTLRFTLVSHSDTIVQIKAACEMVLSARRFVDPSGTGQPDTSAKIRSFSSSLARYVVAEESNPDSLAELPVSSFASRRTAVYKYRMSSLWAAMDANANSQLLTAGFLISNPTPDDTVIVKCIARPEVIRDGALLDSIFAAESGDLVVKKDSLKFGSVISPLQKMYADGSKPADVYLYLRYTNVESEFRTVTLDIKPLFKAMITNP